MSNTAGRLLLGLTSLASAATLGACTASGSSAITGSSIAKSTIEQVASKQISDRFGDGKYTVTCPHDLAAKTGASMKCLTTFPGGEKFTGTAKVTSVKSGKTQWTYNASSEVDK
jgi:hypothetical protein